MKTSLTLGGIILGLTAAVTLMLLSFLAPSMNSGPDGIPVAVSAPDPVVAKLSATADVTTYDDPSDARQAVLDRDAVGAVTVGPDGATVYTASGAGQPYTQVLTGIADGMDATVEDVAPTTQDDPNAGGLNALALPLAFGGMVSAAVLSMTMKDRRLLRVLGSAGFSVAAGLAVGAVLQFGFGTFDGNYWETAAVLALGVAGTSLFVLGLEALLGVPGLAVGAVLTLFVSNPLSGIATGWQWLPSPWGAVGQYMPIGAAGNATRSVAFFDGAGMAHSVWVLVAWVAVGVALVGASALRGRRGA
ncbi:ABC transporter permease [Corynebacterium sp.]|uniref:ABC transporter permease n=1 Tax=Corynebacterium sp. TaxID=1720 RepID=UPI0025BF69FD|nr:ABC transporter permease [Corynebacterium sp.]